MQATLAWGPRSTLTLLLLAVTTPVLAQAGDSVLDVSWDASGDPGASSYRVYFSPPRPDSSDMEEVPAPQTSVQLSRLEPSTTYCVEVSVVRSGGCESSRSARICGITGSPGAACTAVELSSGGGASPPTLEQGDGSQALTVMGSGFQDGLSVRFLQPPLEVTEIDVSGLIWIDESELRFTVDLDPATPLGLSSLEIRNPDDSTAICSSSLRVSFDESRTDVNDSGRVDGFDFSLLNTTFGAFSSVCGFGSSRGNRCDTEDDCGGTDGVTSFCTTRACSAVSPSGAELACLSEADCGGTAGVTTFCSTSPYSTLVDMDGNGLIDGVDLTHLAARFGESVP